MNLASLIQEVFFTFLKRDRVHDTLALRVLEASLNNLKFGGVNHHGDVCDLRVRLKEAHEFSHGLLAIDEPIVQIDIEDLCAVLNLVLGHLQSRLVVSLLNQLLELNTSGNVATLSNVDEGDYRR